MGQKIPAYAVYSRVWVKLEATAVRETAGNKVQTEKSGYTLTLDFIPGITDNMRIEWEKRVFEIKQLVNIGEENRTLEIEIQEVKNES